jgi:hypothetical protein
MTTKSTPQAEGAAANVRGALEGRVGLRLTDEQARNLPLRLIVEADEATDVLFVTKEAGHAYLARHGAPGHYLERVEPCRRGILHTAQDLRERRCQECDGILDCCCHEDVDVEPSGTQALTSAALE